MSNTCETCFHAKLSGMPGTKELVKFCTVNPPVLIGTSQGLMTIQPGLPPAMICGQYKAEKQVDLSQINLL